jgi:hypothetical protein
MDLSSKRKSRAEGRKPLRPPLLRDRAPLLREQSPGATFVRGYGQGDRPPETVLHHRRLFLLHVIGAHQRGTSATTPEPPKRCRRCCPRASGDSRRVVSHVLRGADGLKTNRCQGTLALAPNSVLARDTVLVFYLERGTTAGSGAVMSPAAIGRVIFSLILRRLKVTAISSSAHADPICGG